MPSVIQQLLLGISSGRSGGLDRYVKAALHFDGADAATATQEWTGKAVTFAGNAQLDTAQSKFGGSSLLLDGTGDYITLPDSADFDLPGDFTIDFWFRANALASSAILYDGRPAATQGLYPTIYIAFSGTCSLRYFTNSADRITGSTVLSTGTWYHVALVRKSGSTKLYLNGVQEGSTYTDGNSYINGASRPVIGADGNTIANNNFNGWIDEVRISNGIARWTAAFTPPTVAYNSPTLDDDYTVSLLHLNEWDQAVTTVDENGKAWTFNGNAQLDTAQSKFGGASLLLDGTGDYLSALDSEDWNVAAGDWTIDFWVRFNAYAANTNYGLVEQYTDANNFIQFLTISNAASFNNLRFLAVSGGVTVGDFRYSWNPAPSTNTWYHMAIVRSGSTMYLFIDGVSVTFTQFTAMGTLPNLAAVQKIGYTQRDANYLNGWIDEFRFSKGIARWTANFTAPSSPYGTVVPLTDLSTLLDGYTVTLLHFDDAADAIAATLDYRSSYRSWTFNGNAQLDTAQSKFGGSSLLLDGTGDYLTAPDSADFYMATTDFTIECFVRENSLGALNTIFSQRTDATNNVVLTVSTLGVITFTITATTPVVTMASASGVISTGTWYHIAVVRSGNSWNIYVDGVSVASTTDSDAWADYTGTFQLGADNGGSAFNGWIDEFRISKGIARYTGTFTPPTQAFFD